MMLLQYQKSYLLLFNNVDPFLCKQVAHFISEALEKRNLLLAHIAYSLISFPYVIYLHFHAIDYNYGNIEKSGFT